MTIRCSPSRARGGRVGDGVSLSHPVGADARSWWTPAPFLTERNTVASRPNGETFIERLPTASEAARHWSTRLPVEADPRGGGSGDIWSSSAPRSYCLWRPSGDGLSRRAGVHGEFSPASEIDLMGTSGIRPETDRAQWSQFSSAILSFPVPSRPAAVWVGLDLEPDASKASSSPCLVVAVNLLGPNRRRSVASRTAASGRPLIVDVPETSASTRRGRRERFGCDSRRSA
jgi:hypothetical protein